MTKKFLYQFDTDPLPAVFDNVVAYDGGADHITAYGGVTAAQCRRPGRRRDLHPRPEGQEEHRDLHRRRQHGRRPGAARRRAEEVLRQVSRLDYVRLQRFEHHGRGCGGLACTRPQSLRGKRAVVLAGTGPVGQRAAALLASEGATVAITGRKLEAVQTAPRPSSRASASMSRLAPRRPTRIARRPSRAPTSCSPPAPPESPCSNRGNGRRIRRLELVADANASPPAGIEGVAHGRSRHRRATARSCSARWDSARSSSRCTAPASRGCSSRTTCVLDAEEIYALAKTMVGKTHRERTSLPRNRSPKLHR